MRNLFAHYPLTGLLPYLPIDETDNAVVHVNRPLPHEGDPLLLLQGQF